MKSIKPIVTIVCLILLLSFFGCSQSNISKITDLKCENLREPLGINTPQPRFSWKNISDKEGTSQTAYQILVAGDPKNLTEEKADFWNSGKTQSASTILLDYKQLKIKRQNPSRRSKRLDGYITRLKFRTTTIIKNYDIRNFKLKSPTCLEILS